MTVELAPFATLADAQGRLAQRDAPVDEVTDELTMVYIFDALRNLDSVNPTLPVRTAVAGAVSPTRGFETVDGALTPAGWVAMRKELRSAGNMLNVSMEPNPTGGGRVFDRNSKGKLVDTSLANPDVLRLELEGVLSALGAPTFWGFGFAIAVAGSELAEMRAPAPAAG